MPELPEVETIVRGLRPILTGRTFKRVKYFWPNSIKTSPKELIERLPGQSIAEINRRGKYIVFKLSGPDTLILHLKMSGRLLLHSAANPLPSHVHTIFDLDRNEQLLFKDTRKFGRVYLVSDPAVVLGQLGPEPLSPEFSFRRFKQLFCRRQGRLKPLLLDQTFIAGLGNIYTDESCFCGQLHPQRAVSGLTDRELKRLYQAILKTLRLGIDHNGSTLDEVYQGGNFQNFFKVYGRTGKKCLQCGDIIERIVLSSRSTHFCPTCQPI